MADRTWNGIDARLFDEFPAATAVVLAILIARCPNEHGVYDMPFAYLRRFMAELADQLRLSSDTALAEAIQLLHDTDKVRRYPHGSAWITGKFKRSRQHHIKANQDAACRDISEHNVETLADFKARYCVDIKPANGGTPDPDPDPDPDPEIKIKNTPADAGELSRIASRNAEMTSLFDQLDKLVDQGERQAAIKRPAKQDLAKGCNTLRLIVDTDGIAEDELLAVARWCFITGNNTEFYLANMAHIHLWRKPWKKAGCSAILDACRKYAAAHVDTAKPYYTPPRQEHDFTGGDGEPGPGSIFGDLTDEDRCELEKQRQMAALQEREV